MTLIFPAEEFSARREKVFDQIGPESYALLQGAGPVAGFELFRQTNEFFYLTGLEVPQAYLLMDGTRRTSTIYLPSSGVHHSSEGAQLGAEDTDQVIALTGVQEVHSLEALTGHLKDARIVYTPHAPAEGKLACQDTLRAWTKTIAADPWDAVPTREERFISLIRTRQPAADIRDLSPILNDLRLIKSPREVNVMRHSGMLCARAVVEAIRSTRPGLYEFHLGAVADYIYRVNGVRNEGYRPIIANGENIWYAHYYRNDCPLIDGDLVIMDYAPDFLNYTSDIGRMWPVNGKYSPLQRELYGFVVEYHKTLLKYIRPGVLPTQILAEAAEEMRPIIAATPFSKPIYAEAATRMLEFRGHLSHPVGMAVHDVGRYFDKPMETGLVFALDPQMWIPEEKIYIRVEDTVVVTDSGVEVLTPDAPLELDDMEALMQEPGLLQQFPPFL